MHAFNCFIIRERGRKHKCQSSFDKNMKQRLPFSAVGATFKLFHRFPPSIGSEGLQNCCLYLNFSFGLNCMICPKCSSVIAEFEFRWSLVVILPPTWFFKWRKSKVRQTRFAENGVRRKRLKLMFLEKRSHRLMAECNQVTVLIVVHETPARRDHFFCAGYVLLIERRHTDLNCQSFLKFRHRKNSLSMENPPQYSASEL